MVMNSGASQQSEHCVALTGEGNLSSDMGKNSSERSKNPLISQEKKNQQKNPIGEAVCKNDLAKQGALLPS